MTAGEIRESKGGMTPLPSRFSSSVAHRSDGSKNPIKEEVLLEYLDWWYVLWHQRYSLMLPSAVLLKKEIWEV
jgi:hypothetical protein